MNNLTEGHQCQHSQLEMLLAEGDTDNRDAEYESQYGMSQCHFNTSEDNPEDVEEQRTATHLSISVGHDAAKRTERQTCHLEELQAYRNTDNRDTVGHT